MFVSFKAYLISKQIIQHIKVTKVIFRIETYLIYFISLDISERSCVLLKYRVKLRITDKGSLLLSLLLLSGQVLQL